MEKFKERNPEKTIEIIKNFFKDLNYNTLTSWSEMINNPGELLMYITSPSFNIINFIIKLEKGEIK